MKTSGKALYFACPKASLLRSGYSPPPSPVSSQIGNTKQRDFSTRKHEMASKCPPPPPLKGGAGFSQVIKAVGWVSEPWYCLWGHSTHPARQSHKEHFRSLPLHFLDQGIKACMPRGMAVGTQQPPHCTKKTGPSTALLPCRLVQHRAPGGGKARNPDSRKLQSYTTHPPDQPPPLGG